MADLKYYQYGKEKISVKSKQDVYEKIYFRSIIDSYSQIDKSSGKENKIRDRIVWHLQEKHPFTSPLFQNEIIHIFPEVVSFDSETKTSRADICFVWDIKYGRFIVECKRLYQQPSKNKPYLEDGLIRFIDLRYARTNQLTGMIGFVISGDIDTIFNETAQNTKNFHPTNPKKPILTPTNNNWKYSFTSFHERTDKTEITVYHIILEFKG